jgi:hypothetical protein
MPIDPNRVQSVFLAAVAEPDVSARAALVDRECGADAELRRRVEALLKANDEPDHFLDRPPANEPVVSTIDQPAPESAVGTVLAGRYKLVEPIGEGGMGTVYMAQQTEPVKRAVAVKLVKAGMDTRAVLARFEAERQALALMDHPNIARVFDAGATADGRPFFVMELVKGIPITKYCDDHRLTPRQRLELFVPVCQAVQHAHQKGVIHRDLKPSNVLVALYDDRPVPKVIDFGLAKAAGQPLTDRTLMTAFGAVVGTPEYMSPEQASFNQLDVDTRSDIYSLGVLLYELLTGSPPISRAELQRAGLLEVLRVIREQEPPRPSVRISSADTLPSLAAARNTEPRKLSALVRGDLDWIVMKALEKDRSRRYETATGLAADVQRHLAGETVTAVPPSAGYRVRKFVRRNRTAVITTAAVIAGSLVAVAGQTWNLLQARAAERRAVAAEAKAVAETSAADENARQAAVERDRALRAEAEAIRQKREANDQAAIARAVSDFLAKDLLGQADPARQAFRHDQPIRNSKVTVREVLDRAERLIAGKFRDQPRTEAYLRQTIANTYRALGEDARAVPHAERAVALFATHLGPDDPETLASKTNLAWLYVIQERYDRAEPLFAQALAGSIRTLGPEDSQIFKCKHNLAWLYQARGKLNEAEALYLEVLPALVEKNGADDDNTLACRSNLADLYYSRRQLNKAEAQYQEVLAIRVKKFGADYTGTLETKGSLARLNQARGKYDQAEALFKDVLATAETALGPDNRFTLTTKQDLGWLYHLRGQNARAEAMLAEVVAMSNDKLGSDHPVTLQRKNWLARVYHAQGKSERAEELWREVLAKLAPDHEEVLWSKSGLAMIYLAREDFDRAEPLYLEVLARTEAKRGPDHRLTLVAKSNLASAYWSMGRLDRSIPLFEEVLAARKRLLGAEHPDTLEAAGNLGTNYRDAGRLTEAIQLQEEVYRAAAKHPTLEWVAIPLAEAYVRAGKAEQLIALTADMLKKDRARLGSGSPALATKLAEAGYRLLVVRAYAAAEPILAECLSIRAKRLADDWFTFYTRSMHGEALCGQKKYADAEPLLLSGYEGMKQRMTKIPESARITRLTEALERLVRLYDAWDKPAEAAKWRKELPPTENAPMPREVK